MTESEWKEMLKEDDDKIGMDASDRELCSHTAEDPEVSEMHTLWGCYRTLLNENKRLKDKNASLRAELREVQVRLSDMSAAVVGVSLLRPRFLTGPLMYSFIPRTSRLKTAYLTESHSRLAETSSLSCSRMGNIPIGFRIKLPSLMLTTPVLREKPLYR